MQNAKDTFYEMLRGRLAAINAERTVVIRGVTRPGILVEENEFAAADLLPDCFRLQWTETAIDSQSALPLVTMVCVVDYETAGSGVNGGMDRGRLLAAMDAELLSALNAQPQNACKNNYTSVSAGKSAIPMGTNIWWGTPRFSKAEMKDDRITRSATVAVMSYQEAGEL